MHASESHEQLTRSPFGQHLVKEPTETDRTGRYSCDTSRVL